MEQFTASEVRDWERAYKGTGAAKVFGAFADLLEAREKAAPVATVEDQFGFPIMEWIGDAGEKCPVGTNLYTHSTQAQPTAASVTEEMVERARSAFVQADDGSTGITDAMRSALVAALENPNG